MPLTDLEKQKIIEKIAAMKKPWHSKIETWVAIVAIISSLAGLAFQYSLHDKNLLVARAEKSLALQEKIKAENDKFLVTRERLALAEKVESFQKDLKNLIEEHNKLISTTVPDAKQVKKLIQANYNFLESIRNKEIQINQSAVPEQKEIHYFNWVDQLISSLISFFVVILGFYIVYSFVSKKHPELIQALTDFLKTLAKKEDRTGF